MGSGMKFLSVSLAHCKCWMAVRPSSSCSFMSFPITFPDLMNAHLIRFDFPCSPVFFFLIWLCQVLAEAHKIFIVAFGI